MKLKLTDAVAARLHPPATGKDDYWDTTTRSFGVRVYASGQRSWIVGLCKPGGKHSRHSIGDVAKMKLKEARKLAQAAKDDPAAFFAEREQAKARAEETFGPLAKEFIAHARSKRGRPLRPATVREYRRSLLNHAKPLHALPVADIHRADIASLIRKIAAKHGETSAMRTRAALSRFWSWLIAGNARHIEFNIVAGTEGYATAKRERVFDDDELRSIWTATEGPGDFNLILRLLLRLGCRRAEAAGMRQSEIKDGVWICPGTRTKNHRTLILELPRQVREALDAHPRIVGRDFLFGRGPNGFNGFSKCLERMRARLAFSEKWKPHDARRTMQTRMAALGVSKDLRDRILNHAQTVLGETYDHHSYASEKAHALQLWADTLDRLTGPAQTNVVPLRSA
jgi:integrase